MTTTTNDDRGGDKTMSMAGSLWQRDEVRRQGDGDRQQITKLKADGD